MNEFSFNTLEEVTGSNEGFMLSLLKAIDKALNEYPLKMNAAIEACDIKELGRLAHKFKSSVAYLSYLQLDDLLSNIELAESDQLSLEQTKKIFEEVLPVVDFVQGKVQERITELSV